MDDTILQRMDKRLEHIENALRGDMQNLGVIAKVNILWRSWIWLLCSGSAGLGGVTVWLIDKMI